MIESVLVGTIVAAAAGFLGWNFWKSTHAPASNSPCAACKPSVTAYKPSVTAYKVRKS